MNPTPPPSQTPAPAAPRALGLAPAAAVQPVAPTTLHTPATGLAVAEIAIDVPGHVLRAYTARPADTGGPLPVLLLVSEIFGVQAYIADVARRFAQAGWLVVAPDLFARHGDVASVPDIPSLQAGPVARVQDAEVLGDLDACAAWAAAHGGDPGRLAITGFCWGGRIVWLYAAHAPAVRAGVAWYGRLVGDASPRQPRHPVDVAPRLNAPVLGLYGGADAGIPLDSVERLRQALAGGNPAARASEVVVYPDAPHAFHADYRASYRPADAADGWQRCIDWLARFTATA